MMKNIHPKTPKKPFKNDEMEFLKFGNRYKECFLETVNVEFKASKNWCQTCCTKTIYKHDN